MYSDFFIVIFHKIVAEQSREKHNISWLKDVLFFFFEMTSEWPEH